jgi:hypothetical protein
MKSTVTRAESKLIEQIRERNASRVAKQRENSNLGYAGVSAQRPRRKPSPIQDVETLLRILDQLKE